MIVANERQRLKTRLIVQKGVEFVALKFEDIAIFYTENTIVYVIDKEERKYIANKRLNQLQQELDGALFFRANRQTIININFIGSFRTCSRVKRAVYLSLPAFRDPVIISQENAAAFRKWISEV